MKIKLPDVSATAQNDPEEIPDFPWKLIFKYRSNDADDVLVVEIKSAVPLPCSVMVPKVPVVETTSSAYTDANV